MAARYDLLILPNDAAKKFSLIEDSAGVVQGARGAYLLASRVARVLLTSPGSLPLHPEEGSAIALLPGSVYDSKTLRALVVREVAQVAQYVRRQQVSSGRTIPLSEALKSVEVISVLLPGDGEVRVRLLITSQSDESVKAEVSV